jgi:hypothetical protein
MPRRAGFGNAPGNPHHALVFADAYAELDDTSLGIPTASGGKRKNMDLPRCSANVLKNISQMHRAVESLVFVGYGPVSGSKLTLGIRSEGRLGVDSGPFSAPCLGQRMTRTEGAQSRCGTVLVPSSAILFRRG